MSFTYGEASIVIQGFMIFVTNLFFKMLDVLRETTSCMNDDADDDSMSCMLYSGAPSRNLWTSNYPSDIEQLSTILQVNI